MKTQKIIALTSEYVPSILFAGLLIYMDMSLVRIWPENEDVDTRIKLILLFIHLVVGMAVCLPLINYGLSKLNQEAIDVFLDLPRSDKPITYTVIYDYLSGLALAAFYLTMAFFTFKEAYAYFHWAIATLYIFVMVVLSFFIATMAMLRMLTLYTRFGNIRYSLFALMTFVFCMAVLNATLRMVSS